MTKELINKSYFAYPKMYDAVQEYITWGSEAYGYPYQFIRKCKTHIFKVFKDYEPNSITKENLLSIVDDAPLNIITINFIILLCERGYIDESNSLMLFKDYKNLFDNQGHSEKIKKFIELDNNFLKQYIKFHPNLDNNEKLIFQISPYKIPFVDEDLKRDIFAYFNNLKLTMTVNNVSVCDISLYVCKHLFSKIKKEDINCNSIAQHLKESWVKSSSMLEVNKILKFLFDNSLLESKELNYAVNIKDRKKAMTTEEYIQMLEDPNVYKYYITIRSNNSNYLFYINTDVSDILDHLKQFVDSLEYKDAGFSYFLSNFDKSVDGLNIKSIYDLDLKSFNTQINFYKDHHSTKILSQITAFYNYIANNINPNLFDNNYLSSRILTRRGLSQDIADGYHIVRYNMIEEVPTYNKWILFYLDKNETNSMAVTSSSISIDFSTIKNLTYRNWVKTYFWKSNESLITKKNAISPLCQFFNYIDDLKKGKIFSIYAKPNDDENITINETKAFKNYIYETYQNDNTVASHIRSARTILNFLYENDDISESFSYNLSIKRKATNTSKVLKNEEIQKLSKLMELKSKDSIDKALYNLVFFIALQTEFRATQVFALTVNCVKETLKKGQYVLISKTKTSANEEIEQPITSYTKENIDKIIELTKEYREQNVIDGLSDYLFLAPSNKKGSFKILNMDGFNDYLQQCCKELNLPLYTYSNLRDTHMTKAEEFVIRQQLSEMHQNILTGHKTVETDNKYYTNTDINEILESVHGVVIGDVNIEGKVQETLPADIATETNTVSNRCGYCQNKGCDNTTMLDCLLCSNFVTTLNRLPYFEEQVKIIDSKIKDADISHDKEDLVNIKVLHLGYIKAIHKLKKDKGL